MPSRPRPFRLPIPCDALATGEAFLDARGAVCGRCPHPIHDLRGWTRSRAERFARAQARSEARVCVVLSATPEGDVLFAPERGLIPMERLLRRWRTPALAGGLALSLACGEPTTDAPVAHAPPVVLAPVETAPVSAALEPPVQDAAPQPAGTADDTTTPDPAEDVASPKEPARPARARTRHSPRRPPSQHDNVVMGMIGLSVGPSPWD